MKVRLSSPNVVVPVAQESAEQVDGQDAQALLRLDLHDGQHGLVQNGVANVFAGVRVGGDLAGAPRQGGAGLARGTPWDMSRGCPSPPSARRAVVTYARERVGQLLAGLRIPMAEKAHEAEDADLWRRSDRPWRRARESRSSSETCRGGVTPCGGSRGPGRTCRKGSAMPLTSCSDEPDAVLRAFMSRTRSGTLWRNGARAERCSGAEQAERA